jgi:hypothetical protein
MKKSTFASAVFLALTVATLINLEVVTSVSANPNDSIPQLSMPIEHVNYTITQVNGTLWAKIDGNYPINIVSQPSCVFAGNLPMVYPMPPGSTNIQVMLNEKELAWSNYSATNSGLLHQTAIGDWWMIQSLLTDVSDRFVLKIHYEHPLQTVNNSYLFLYDLNINPYLSAESTNSTAYFTVRMETNTTNLQVFTAPPNAPSSQWKPLNYTETTEGSTSIVAITMYSEYEKVLAGKLPGDLVLVFSDADQVPEFPSWTVPVMLAAVLVATLVLAKKSRKPRLKF